MATTRSLCTWLDKKGKPVTSTSFAIHKVTPAPTMPAMSAWPSASRSCWSTPQAYGEARSHAVHLAGGGQVRPGALRRRLTRRRIR